MTDSNGALTDAEMTLVLQWLRRHWKGADFGCPVCKANTWMAWKEIILTPIYTTRRDSPPNFAAFAAVSCKTCGYVMTFSVSEIGIDLEGATASDLAAQEVENGGASNG
jgi:predicted nucleic-acid-binding Zn-ribbon protein